MNANKRVGKPTKVAKPGELEEPKESDGLRKRLKDLDPDFGKRPEAVKRMMVFAIRECNATIREIPDGTCKIVFMRELVVDPETGNRELGGFGGRTKFVHTFQPDSTTSKKICDKMPWELFEDTPEKRAALIGRVQQRVVPTEEVLGGRLVEDEDDYRDIVRKAGWDKTEGARPDE